MEIMELLKSRRTYRRFEQKPVEDNIVNDILTAARYASSAANRQPAQLYRCPVAGDCEAGI